jgi:hypothetical protein
MDLRSRLAQYRADEAQRYAISAVQRSKEAIDRAHEALRWICDSNEARCRRTDERSRAGVSSSRSVG